MKKFVGFLIVIVLFAYIPIYSIWPIDYSSKTLLKKVSSNTDFKQFKKMIAQAKKYIFSGDSFQVVLSRCFKKKITTSPISIYRALRYLNPSP